MKKLINIFVIVALLSLGGVAFAQSGRANVGAVSTTSRSAQAIKNFLKNRAEHKWTKMIERFDKALEKEENVMNRLASRIAKIKASGKTIILTTHNPKVAEKFLTEAQTHLNLAKTSLENLRTLVASAITEEEAGGTISELKDNMIAMRKAAGETKTHIIETHKALQKIVGSLRGISQLRNASSTPSI